MKTIASASIYLLNDFMCSSSSLMRLASFVAQLSPEAIKKLEDLREGCQSTRTIDFSRLLLVTKLVAIGVVLEGLEIILEITRAVKKRWGASRRWGEKSAEDHIPDWIKVIGLVGWVLVSIGVAGEFWMDSRVNTDDEHIQSINITLLQDAGASAAQARSDANSAHDIAQGASVLAETAGNKAVIAGTQAKAIGAEADRLATELDEQRDRASKAEIAIAAAQQSANQEREARLKLEEDISPRILEQAESAKSLRLFQGTRFAIKVVDGADLETRRFAGQIRVLCQMANWTEDKSLVSLSTAQGTEEGVMVEYNPTLAAMRRVMPPEDSTDEPAMTLIEVLEKNKIQPMRWPRGLSITMPPLPGHTIIIHVGLKPVGAYFMQERLKDIPTDPNGNKILGNSLTQ